MIFKTKSRKVSLQTLIKLVFTATSQTLKKRASLKDFLFVALLLVENTMIENKVDVIMKEHPRADVNFIKEVYKKVLEMSKQEKDITITKVANELGLKRNKIGRTFKVWLIPYGFVQKIGNGRVVPFFRLTNHKGEAVNFIYGKEKRDSYLDEDLQKLRLILANKVFAKLIKMKKNDKQHNYLNERNQVIENFWKNKTHEDIEAINLNCKASRFKVK